MSMSSIIGGTSAVSYPAAGLANLGIPDRRGGYGSGMELADCAALVTGGRSGIGAAIAADLRTRGAQVAIADREQAEIAADLTQPGAAARMVDAAVERLGGLDLLVNNAGGYSAPTYPANDGWRSPLELNLLAVMEAIRRALPTSPGGPAASSTSPRPPGSDRTPIRESSTPSPRRA